MGYWEDDAFVGLEGRELISIGVSPGESSLRLAFADGSYRYAETDGDCCSESWWADILGAKAAYGGVVTGVRTLDLPHPDDNRSRQESDVVYGYALDTTKGTVTFAFRNSSNGYYGGSSYAVETSPSATWAEVDSNDWRA